MAGPDTLLLEIVTPTGVALSEHVTDVTAPSIAGEFGVLPGHLPLLAGLRTGIVTYHQDGAEHRFAVAQGFAEVAHERTLLLTDRFAHKDDVNVIVVRERLKEVSEEITTWQGELAAPRRKDLIEEEQWLAVQLELIGDPPPPTVREDTRFLAAHAETLPLAEQIEGQQPDEDLTDHVGPGSAFPDPK